MSDFLVVYDRRRNDLLQIEAFDETHAAQAPLARYELERKYLGDPEIEVVILSADNFSDLIRTHSRYFRTVEDQLKSWTTTVAG